ncbi:MAG TPA: hypothetical protein VLT92_06640 [Burkholderiales bacterium]|nr:hypothetical protein [Burkholderiales bacterium]
MDELPEGVAPGRKIIPDCSCSSSGGSQVKFALYPAVVQQHAVLEQSRNRVDVVPQGRLLTDKVNDIRAARRDVIRNKKPVALPR